MIDSTAMTWPPVPGSAASPWEEAAGPPAMLAGVIADLGGALRVADARRGAVLVPRFGTGAAPAFWAGWFDRVIALQEASVPFTAIDVDGHRIFCGPATAEFRLRALAQMPPLDALVIDAPDLPQALAQYFLFRRSLRAPALVLFAADDRNPGAARLADRLRSGELGSCPELAPVAGVPAGAFLAVERVERLPVFPAPGGRVPRWTPPAVAAVPTRPRLEVLFPDLRGHRVFRWFGCFAAVRLGAGGEDGPWTEAEAVFRAAPADYRMARSLPAVIGALNDPVVADPGGLLASAIRDAAARGGASVWGTGSDLLRALAGRADLGPPIADGRLVLADRAQAGLAFCGRGIVAPEALAAGSGPVILSAADAATRAALRLDAVRLGIDPLRLVDPYS